MKNDSHFSSSEANPRAQALFESYREKAARRADQLFTFLMPIQWALAIVLALSVSPDAWASGGGSYEYLWKAMILGGALTLLPLALVWKIPGGFATRTTIAICQMLMSSLLIYLTAGRLETHFHIFGSLAFLAFYRDWRLLLPAAAIAIGDNFLHEIYDPSNSGKGWGFGLSWLEHSAWILFENTFLIYSCRMSVNEMWQTALAAAAHDDSEARYRATVEQTTEGIFLLSEETLDVIECNEAFARLIGYGSAEEAKGLNAFEFDRASAREIEQMTRIAKEKGGSLSTERKYRRKDGSEIYVEISGRHISFGENSAYCINARDISARRKVESEMKRLALVAQKTQNAVIITNPEGEIEWANPGFTRITGYEFEEVKGLRPGSFLQGPESDPETIAAIREAIRLSQPFDGEIFNYSKDGRGYWISLSIMPIHGRRGGLKGFIAVEMDVTDRKNLENDLRGSRDEMEKRVAERTAELGQAQQFLRKVIDNVPNMIFVKDPEGRYTLANQALSQLYGIKAKDIIGKSDAELIADPAEAEAIMADDRHVVEEMEEKVVFEQKFTDRKGNVHWLQTVKRPMLGDEGVENILGISTDMTERKVLESQLRHAQKLESIGQLAAGIAHEINTPTQYVGDNTRFIRDAFQDFDAILAKYGRLFEEAKNGAPAPETLKSIEDEINAADLPYLLEEVPNAIGQSLDGISRIAMIVQSMKDFAHPGARDKQAIDLNRAIESTVTVARNEWKYVADLETRFDPSLPPVPCFLGEFNQVVLNMVINASHAIRDAIGDGSNGKGKIIITTTKAGEDWAEVRISDSGTGIPENIRSKVFDPFFTTKEVGKGTGQGLAISHNVVVDKHRGRLSLESEEGKGTTFIIQLPLNEGREAPAA